MRGVAGSRTRPCRYSEAWRVASVNREIQVGSCTPKSVPKTEMSASLRSASVGSSGPPSCRSVVTTRYVRPSGIGCSPCTPDSSWRMPEGGSCVTWTSAMRLLRVASHPGNPIPAALRIALRPPSAPTRNFARIVPPSRNSTSTPSSSWTKPVTSRPRSTRTPSWSIHSARIGSIRFCQRASPYGCRVGKSLMSNRNRRTSRSARSAPRRGTGPRSRVSRGSRWSVSGIRLPGSGQLRCGASLHDGRIHARQGKLAGQHHPGGPLPTTKDERRPRTLPDSCLGRRLERSACSTAQYPLAG